MISVTGTTGIRRFQEQIIPNYLGQDLDFSYDLSIFEPSENIYFGVRSENGVNKSEYRFLSGFIYDYSGRAVSTYQNGETRINYGLKYETLFGETGKSYLSYEQINDRPISFGDKFVNYSGNPFDRFYIENKGSKNFSFAFTIAFYGFFSGRAARCYAIRKYSNYK